MALRATSARTFPRRARGFLLSPRDVSRFRDFVVIDGFCLFSFFPFFLFCSLQVFPPYTPPPISRADVGKRVRIEGYSCCGTLQFFGPHKTKGGNRCGIVLEKAVGKNNGTVPSTLFWGYFRDILGTFLTCCSAQCDSARARVACSSCRPCLLNADWCLPSDVMALFII